MKSTAVLFDLDGTLLLSEMTRFDAWVKAFAEVMPGCSTEFAVILASAAERNADKFWADQARAARGRRDLRRAAEIIASTTLRQFLNTSAISLGELGSTYRMIRDQSTVLAPGAAQALAALRSESLLVGLVTNGQSRVQREKLDRFRLYPYFDAVLIEEELGEGKPTREVFAKALGALDATAESTWMVGDDFGADIVVPAELGMRTIWINSRGTEPPAEVSMRPTYVLPSIYPLSRGLRFFVRAYRHLSESQPRTD